MNDVLYLAWRYLSYHRLKTSVLVASVAIIIYLPLGLNILIRESALQLRGRAEETPLIVGDKGSPLELVLRTLYFQTDEPSSIPFAESKRVARTGFATAIPIYTRFRSRHGPIVGTSLEYFAFRRLEISEGRAFGMLGECVVGSEVAQAASIEVGDHVLSSSEGVFDLAGIYPLKMRVVGVLASSDSADDSAVFVDLKTTWIIQGLGHGHQDLKSKQARDAVLRKEGNKVIANSSVLQYNEIRPENVNSFHFHGNPATFPITSVIAVPNDEKSKALLRGRYLSESEMVQVVQPSTVVEQLLTTVFTVGRYITLAVVLVGLSTFSTMFLVFLLSIQLRRRELETMTKIGSSRPRIWQMLGAEILFVLALGSIIAGGMAGATYAFSGTVFQWMVQ